IASPGYGCNRYSAFPILGYRGDFLAGTDEKLLGSDHHDCGSHSRGVDRLKTAGQQAAPVHTNESLRFIAAQASPRPRSREDDTGAQDASTSSSRASASDSSFFSARASSDTRI